MQVSWLLELVSLLCLILAQGHQTKDMMEAVVRTQVCAVRIMSMVHSSDRRQDCEWVAVRWGSDEPGHEGPPSISACTGEMEDVCCFPPAPFPVPCIYWGAPEWIKERRGRNWIRTWGYLHTFCIEKVQECSKQPLNHPWDRGKAARCPWLLLSHSMLPILSLCKAKKIDLAEDQDAKQTCCFNSI